MKFKSVLSWPLATGFCDGGAPGVTEDIHNTREQALAVCRSLMRDGLIVDGKTYRPTAFDVVEDTPQWALPAYGTLCKVAMQCIYPATGKTGTFLITGGDITKRENVRSPLFRDMVALCQWAAQQGFISQGYNYLYQPTIALKVVTISTKPNAFGLHGVIMIARNGAAFEAATYQGPGGNGAPLVRGDIVKLPVTNPKASAELRYGWTSLAGRVFEIPRALPLAPPRVVAEVWDKIGAAAAAVIQAAR